MEEENRNQRISQAAQTALNLSHGVKNILQAVRGGSEVLEKCLEIKDIDRAKRSLKILQRNLGKIEKLVLDMLRYSSQNKPEFQDCDFNNIVSTAIETLTPGAEELEKKIELTIDPQAASIKCDQNMIYEVVLNLVLNAIYAVMTHTGLVKVGTEYQWKDRTVTLTVRDNGPGIADTEKIFEPFHTTKSKVGTGLGLAITKKIVSEHKGTILVQSLPGQGAAFTVTLPTDPSC